MKTLKVKENSTIHSIPLDPPADETVELYGFELDLTQPDPTQNVRYIEDNEHYSPAAMGESAFSYGDWRNAFFIKNLRPCVLNFDGTVAYDLDVDNYNNKADGTSATIGTSCPGNVMVGIPTVWMKIDTSNLGKPKIYISNVRIDNRFHAFAHHDNDGNIIPYTYLPAYNGYVMDGKLRSISGVNPTREQTGPTQITEARANNPSGKDIWDIEKWVDIQLIDMLLILIGKSTNTQAVFGQGNNDGYNNHASGSDGYGVLPTGTLNDKGLFFGYTGSANLAVKVFGIENWWGNIWRRVMGMMLSDGWLYYKLTKDKLDGSSISYFDPSAIADSAGVPYGWINSGMYFGESNYVTTMRFNKGQFLIPSPTNATPAVNYSPAPGSGSQSTYECDHFWTNASGNKVLLFGGTSYGGGQVGAFCLNLSYALSGSGWGVGAAPSCKPSL